jgi:cell division protein FtsB
VKQQRRGPGRGRTVASGLKRLVVPVLLLLTAYYGFFGGEYSVFEWREADANVVEEQARLELARAEIEALKVELELLERDPATIERIAREDFGMIREDEVLYRFTDGHGTGQREVPPAR